MSNQELLSYGQALFLQCNWVPAPPVMCCEANPPSKLYKINIFGSWVRSSMCDENELFLGACVPFSCITCVSFVG